ncbi:DinB family protein [Mucilaginibacter xinganensis]|uniref:Putative damage-inducible protein DinB (Forms a four-helix bundle) n=1 Tax=Mucilaginibacter xinganensis TaxID=1234841 RepID=A0A223NW44_9SPHI|nr:DinB family protein [Mucilaginibacter xinganensis]ASU34095.1 putative damage-inducible protein DinB (forms a four-helix bundle) [Mucilaginibacter xinganensis]
MKTYFIRLLNYDRYANEVMLNSIIEAEMPRKSIELMAHLLSAQQIWLSRCKGLVPVGSILWPDWDSETLNKVINNNHNEWLEYLNGLQPGDFEKPISYKNLKGDSFENKLADILAHLINHGTHHRAQIGQQLKFSGAETLPVTDYIAYTRQFDC